MGMIGKYKIIFDTTDPATSDNIGAYLRSSDGTLLTHTTVSGKEALDVNVANTISTTNSANYAEDSVHGDGDDGTFILSRRADTPSSSAGADGDYAALNTDANGRLYTQIHDGGNSITVDGTVAVTQSTSPWVVGDGGGSLTVDAVDLDIRDLTHASDSVKVGDGTDFWAIDGTGLGRVADYFTASSNAAVTVDTTVGGVALAASPLADRTELWVQNNGNKDVFIGSGTVSAANGFKLVPGSALNARIGPSLVMKAIAASGSQDVRILQFA